MTNRQTTNFPRVEVKARISSDLHRRLLDECGHCGCHINGFIAIAIAHEVAKRRRERQLQADVYIEQMAFAFEAEHNA
jgi:hypothetical protein